MVSNSARNSVGYSWVRAALSLNPSIGIDLFLVDVLWQKALLYSQGLFRKILLNFCQYIMFYRAIVS